MTATPRAPEFGEADLSNCELEKIHLPSSIQPHGAMLVVREHDLVVIQASAGAHDFLELNRPVLGSALAQIDMELGARVRPHLTDALGEIPAAVRCRIGRNGRTFDGVIHRPPSGGLVIELEHAGPEIDLTDDLARIVAAIAASPTLRLLCDESARLVKAITGYDRVMIYRFDEAGHGNVFAEEREAGLEPYLGNYYPASDIPQMARRLYERARVRLLVDVNYAPVPLRPSLSPLTGQPLDMSLCRLRSMSPIHIQYLKNMGVRATLVISVLVSGKLWGLIACHHYAPRRAQFETLAVCEILAETLATRIAALESFNQGQAQLLVRRVEQRMIDAAARQGDWRVGLFDGSDTVLKAVNATGAALLCDEQISTIGEVPATADLRAVAAWLDGRPRTSLTFSNSFGLENPGFGYLTPIASGLLAAPVSNLAGEYVLWFRPEQVRTVTWGGDPHKPVVIGDDPANLSPRRSFAQWHQLVEGSSADWVPTDLITARMIADSVSDVLLQFRSLRVLVAEDHFNKVLGQVRGSDQPVVIAHPSGDILLSNDAFRRLLPPPVSPRLKTLRDIAELCADGELRRRLTELVRDHRAWRGEVTLKVAGGQAANLLARADPVFSAPDRVLGYVLMFEDRAERKAADHARRRFQDAIVARRRFMPSRFGSTDEVRLRELVSTLLDNAQLAALEITDGMQPSEMPEMLARIEDSVARSATLLTLLMRMRGL